MALVRWNYTVTFYFFEILGSMYIFVAWFLASWYQFQDQIPAFGNIKCIMSHFYSGFNYHNLFLSILIIFNNFHVIHFVYIMINFALVWIVCDSYQGPVLLLLDIYRIILTYNMTSTACSSGHATLLGHLVPLPL